MNQSCKPNEELNREVFSKDPRTSSLRLKLTAVTFMIDAGLVVVALFLAYYLRFETPLAALGVAQEGLGLRDYLGHIAFGSVILCFLFANFNLYEVRNFLSYRRVFRIIGKSCLVWFGLYLALSLILKFNPPISRMYCGIGFMTAMALLLSWRWFNHSVVRRERFARRVRQKAVFVGWSHHCERAMQLLGEGRGHPVDVIGVIAPPGGIFELKPPRAVPVLGRYECRNAVLRETGAEMLLVTDMDLPRKEMLVLAADCEKEMVDFKLVPNCFQILLSGLHLESLSGMPVLGISRLPLHNAINSYLKRAVDIVGAIVGLVVAFPAIAIFGFLIYRESPGPIFYRQQRVGQDGRLFDIIKLRSMKLDAEADGRVGWTIKDDPRRLKVGAFMRAWNIDEVPQFWNVLKGEMSLVGPRPERNELISKFKEEIPHYNARHGIKPGITGWAQVNGLRGDTDLSERVQFDLHYIENWNLFFDFQIMFQTFFKRANAC
ncbi:MAG: exopolysaccharide biosynthesis polyprenyl glycosylphosphotransferase [Verrucomicrobiota bacterium]